MKEEGREVSEGTREIRESREEPDTQQKLLEE